MIHKNRKMVDYHIHINHFGDTLFNSQKKLEELGFKTKRAQIFLSDIPQTLWLVKYETQNSSERNETYKVAQEIIKNDPSFKGYMEHETLPSDYIFKFDQKPFTNSVNFPVSNLNKSEKSKIADIHLFRDQGNFDTLDDILIDNGFYLVQTESSKIWTLLINNLKDFNTLRECLPGYISNVGGIREAEFEIVGAIWKSDNFSYLHSLEL